MIVCTLLEICIDCGYLLLHFELQKGKIRMRIIRKVKDITNLIISTTRRRDSNLYVFGSWYGEKFADNSKYLYLYYLKNGKDAYWFTKNKVVYEELKKNDLPVLMAGTKEEQAVSKRAKYFFYCCSLDDIDKYFSGGAVMINLWHGVPLKKIMFDDTYNYNTGKKSLYEKMAQWVFDKSIKKRYVAVTSKVFADIYRHAFRVDESHILNLGQPRNDCFFDGSMHRKKYGSKEYKKLITYMPTMRNMGKDVIDLNKLMDLPAIDRLCKENDALFLIKKHFAHRNETTNLEGFENVIDMTTTAIDSQELLFNTDILITDYSSCYIDYMLLNRQIIFYAYDLHDYLAKDREMYFQYDDVTPGVKATNFEQLFEQIEKGLKGNYHIDDDFIKAKNLFYDKPNQGIVSPEIMKIVNTLH